jgi:DNA-binding XRE family transcriptional regulator
MKNLVVELRTHLEMTQAELAESIGIYQADISNIEAGRRLLSASLAIRMWDRYRTPLKRLGFKLEDLLKLGREDAPEASKGGRKVR